MRIRRSWIVASGLLVAGAATPGEPLVQALRFRQYFVESAFEMAHGGGAWHDCLYLPDAGVMCTVQWQWRAPASAPGAAPQVANRGSSPLLHARRVDLAAALAHRPAGSVWSDRPPEPVVIDAELARRIVQRAQITTQQAELARGLGSQLVAAGAVGGADSATPEHVTIDASGQPRVVSSR